MTMKRVFKGLALAAMVGFGISLGVDFQPVQWGAVGLRIDPIDKTTSAFKIVGADNIVKRTIVGQDFQAYFVEMTGQQPEELWVRAFTQKGGSATDYFFTLEGGLRNIGVIDGKGSGVTALEDLDEDGKAEVVMFGTPLTFMLGLKQSQSPFLTSILGWDKLRFYDATAKYPKRVRTTILFHFYDFLRAVEQNDVDAQKASALGYYANSLQIGEGRIAKAWLMRNAPKDLRRWLLDNESRMVNTFYTYPGCRVTITQTRELPIDFPSCTKEGR
jgi:hypothetical protein